MQNILFSWIEGVLAVISSTALTEKRETALNS